MERSPEYKKMKHHLALALDQAHDKFIEVDPWFEDGLMDTVEEDYPCVDDVESEESDKVRELWRRYQSIVEDFEKLIYDVKQL